MKHASQTPSVAAALRPLSNALLVSLALVGPLAMGQAHAQSAPAAGTAAHRSGGMQMRWMQAIGTTAAQQTQIQAIFTQARADVAQIRSAAGNPRQKMAQALAAPTVDASAAETARQSLLTEQSSISQRMLQARLQVAALLTPDQRQKLLALEQQRRGRWQGAHAKTNAG